MPSTVTEPSLVDRDISADLAEAKKFLRALCGQDDLSFSFAAFADHPSAVGAPFRVSGTIDECWPQLVDASKHGHGIFVTVQDGGTKKTDIQRLRAVFVDDDTGTLTVERLAAAPPSLVVQSAHGLHCYWSLIPEDFNKLEQFTPVQKALAAKLGTDPKVSDLARVMRLPGLAHRKDPANPFLVRVLREEAIEYSLAEIVETFALDLAAGPKRAPSPTPPAPQPAAAAPGAESDFVKKARAHAQKSGKSQTFKFKKATGTLEERKTKARNYLAKMGPAIQGQGGDQHTFRAAAVCVRDFALDDDSAFEVLVEWNKTCQPPWSEDDLQKKIANAHNHGAAETGSKMASDGDGADGKGADGDGADGHAAPETKEAKCYRILKVHSPALTGMPGPIWFNAREFSPNIGDKSILTDDIVPIVQRNLGKVDELVFVDKNGEPCGVERWSESMIRSQFVSIAKENTVDPVLRWLESLPAWDGTDRVGDLLAAYSPKGSDPLYRRFLECSLRSAVARVLWPGCKVDTLLILFDPQGGTKKSTGFEALFGKDFFGDPAFTVDNKDSWMLINRTWVIEFAELAQLRSSRSREALKAFISRRNDAFRAPYGHDVADHPRRSIFVGSTNQKMILEDDGGNRRFHVVEIGKADLEKIKSIREQVWAQALHEVRAGATWWLEGEEEIAHAEQVKAHTFEDIGITAIETWLKGKNETSLDDIVTNVEYFRTGRGNNQNAIAGMLRKIGFEAGNPRRDGGRRRRTWVRITPVEKSGVFSGAKVIPFSSAAGATTTN